MHRNNQREHWVLPVIALLPLFLISLVLIGVGLHYRSITSIPPHLPQAQPVAPDQVEPQSEPLVQELDLIGDSPDADSLATAEEALSKGFKVFTEIASSHPERLMRHLLSFRQGLIVVEDASGLFFLQQGLARKKIVVDGALASEVDIRALANYSMESPREIPDWLKPYLGVPLAKGDTVFLVMPRTFESAALAGILKHLPADSSSASVTLSISPNGLLQVSLKAYETPTGVHELAETFTL